MQLSLIDRRNLLLRSVSYGAICLFLLVFCTAEASAASKSPQALYEKLCGVCHGNNGNGHGRASANLMPPPTNFTSPLSLQRLDRKLIIAAMRDGKPGTAMSAYGKRLSAPQMASIADYMLSTFMAGKTTPAPGAAKSNPSGKEIYIKNCSACHGDNGNTAVWARNGLTPPPRNFTTPQAREELSIERMIVSVTYGRPGTAMMPFKSRLSSEEIQSVVRYVRSAFMGLKDDNTPININIPEKHVSLSKPVSKAVASVDFNAPMPNNLHGDVKRGEAFYQHNCFTCHGRTGEGNGPRAFFNTPRPRNFTSDDTRQNFNRPRLFNAITHGKPGSVMPAWGKVLNQQQIADVAEYVFETFVHVSAKKKP